MSLPSEVVDFTEYTTVFSEEGEVADGFPLVNEPL